MRFLPSFASFVLIFNLFSPVALRGQLSGSWLTEGGMRITPRVELVSIFDAQVDFAEHHRHGPYFSLGFEMQSYSYKVGGLRQRLNFDLAAESLYILARMALSNDWKDPDGRFGTSTYFHTGIVEYVPIIPLYTQNLFSLGLGGALYDLNYQHLLYDAQGQPENPEESAISLYGFYAGWSAFCDVLISPSLSLHTDFYYGYNFYNGSEKKLAGLGEPERPLRSGKLTSTLQHDSGLLFSFRYHQVFNRSSIASGASRLSMGLGYRF